MALKATTLHLKRILSDLHADLEKAERGNKSACQRVRTGTIHLAKISKIFRRESIAQQKKERRSPKK